jgi:glycosyltransferase
MKITIITPTKNAERTISDTLYSSYVQTRPPDEHIVVDSASCDNTVSILKQFSQVRYIPGISNDGIYTALNRGIREATGDVIGVLNADDMYEHASVLEQVETAFQDHSLDAVYGDVMFVHQENIEQVVRVWRSGEYTPGAFWRGWMLPHTSLFIARSIFDECGHYRESFKISADYEFMIRAFAMKQRAIRYIPDILVRMRAGGESNRQISNRIRAHIEDFQSWRGDHRAAGIIAVPLKPIRKVHQWLLSGKEKRIEWPLANKGNFSYNT